MIRNVVGLMALALVAQDCDFGDLGGLVAKPRTVTVTNVSDSQIAVVAIIADDVKSYPTLAAGAAASVRTNVGGSYEVRVVMTPENAATYRAELRDLRTLVERQVDRTTDPTVKTQLF